MIEITKAMRENSELKFLEQKTDKAILAAVERGQSKAIFPLDENNTYFTPLRDLYTKAGYKLLPIGICGGVRQIGYYITW